MLGLHLLCSLNSSIPVNPSRRIKGREKKSMRSYWKVREGRMLTGGESYKTQSHIFPKSSSRQSPLLFNSLKRGKTFFALQGRSLSNEALLNKQTEESPLKLLIKQAHGTKGKLLLNNPPPLRTNIYLRPQIKHITTSQQKYVSQWDLSRVQLNKSLEISRTSLKREHVSTVKHSHWKLHS